MSGWRSAALLVSAVALTASRFHPIHAARVELDAPATGAVTVTVHVYRDDFPADTALPAVTRYLDRVLAVTDVRGDRVPLRAMTITMEGDRWRIALAGNATRTLSRGRITVTLLQDRYPDQVDVVDARVQGRRAQLLFLRGDPAQALP